MPFRKIFLFVLIAELLIALLAINNYGATLEGLQATTRFSGRLSLAVFTIIFIFLPFNRSKLEQFLSSKPFLVFAIVHGIHLFELLSYVYLSDANLIPIRLAGGFLAYVFIFTMPILHFYYESGKINQKKFSIAENIYVYYVWFIFFMSYLPRVQGKLPNAGGSYPEFVALLIWVCFLLVIRFYHMFLQRKAYA
jgi:hypothetical protein